MSEFKFACPVCRQHIRSDSSASGTQIECPTCFQKIVVPQAPADATSKLILSATQAPGKRPLPEVAEAPAAAARPPAWRAVLAAGLAVLVLAAAAYALIRSGVFKSRSVVAQKAPTNAVAPPSAPSWAAPDPRWRLDLAGAQIPTNAASGRIRGRAFQLQRATIQNGTLALRQGPSWPPEVGVTILLPPRPAQDYAGKQFLIPPDYAGKAPRIVLRTKDAAQKEITQSVTAGYAMKLEFGQIAEGTLPGRIYLCTPDEAKSVVVGSFTAEIRKPPPPKTPGSPQTGAPAGSLRSAPASRPSA